MCDIGGGVGEKAYVRAENNTQRVQKRTCSIPPPDRERITMSVSCVQHPPYLIQKRTCVTTLTSATSTTSTITTIESGKIRLRECACISRSVDWG